MTGTNLLFFTIGVAIGLALGLLAATALASVLGVFA